MHYIYEDQTGSRVHGREDFLTVNGFSFTAVLQLLRDRDKFLQAIPTADISMKNLPSEDNFTSEAPLVVEIKGKLHKWKYTAGASLETIVDGIGQPLLGLDLVYPVKELIGWFKKRDVSQAFHLKEVDTEVCYKALDRITVFAYEMGVAQTSVPRSKTYNSASNLGSISVLFYCPDDDQGVLAGRLMHELTHALRYCLSIEQGNKMMRTPTKVSLPSVKGKYKMHSDRVHSGYIAEHELRGGITVYLTGSIREGENVKDIDTPIAETVITKEIEGDWDRLIVKDGETKTKIIYHMGELVTRS